LDELASRMLPGPLGSHPLGRKVGGRFAGTFVKLRYRVASPGAAAAGREQVTAAMDRLEAELDANGTGYLVGERFTVADLTAAALFYPVAQPPEGPRILPSENVAMEEFFGPLRDRPGGRWVAEMFRRHRLPGSSVTAGAA
jgi:glutathione S-transferase